MVIGQDNLPWSILTVVRARFIKIIWQKRWNISLDLVDADLTTGDTRWHSTESRHKHSLKYPSDCVECGLWCWWWWSVLVKCDNNVVDLSTSDIADTLLLPSFILAGRWSPLQSNLEIQMLEASPVLCHQHIVDIPGQSDRQPDTLYCTSDWRLAEIYLLLLPRHYQEINVQHRLCSDVWPVIGQIIKRPHLAWQDIT